MAHLTDPLVGETRLGDALRAVAEVDEGQWHRYGLLGAGVFQIVVGI
jgi:hypothetical protein